MIIRRDHVKSHCFGKTEFIKVKATLMFICQLATCTNAFGKWNSGGPLNDLWAVWIFPLFSRHGGQYLYCLCFALIYAQNRTSTQIWVNSYDRYARQVPCVLLTWLTCLQAGLCLGRQRTGNASRGWCAARLHRLLPSSTSKIFCQIQRGSWRRGEAQSVDRLGDSGEKALYSFELFRE